MFTVSQYRREKVGRGRYGDDFPGQICGFFMFDKQSESCRSHN